MFDGICSNSCHKKLAAPLPPTSSREKQPKKAGHLTNPAATWGEGSDLPAQASLWGTWWAWWAWWFWSHPLPLPRGIASTTEDNLTLSVLIRPVDFRSSWWRECFYWNLSSSPFPLLCTLIIIFLGGIHDKGNLLHRSDMRALQRMVGDLVLHLRTILSLDGKKNFWKVWISA